MTPAVLETLRQLAPAALRELIAVAAGLHAHHDQGNAETVATALRRIADRLTGQPRTAS